jgi:hypothetical protein
MDGNETIASVRDLRQRKTTLEWRLEDGYARIGAAEIEGRDIAAWEQFWLELLSEYEHICDELLDAA